MATLPIRLKINADALAELELCEYGSYEDNIQGDTRLEEYAIREDGTYLKHIVELIQERTAKNAVTLRTQEEVDEFFAQMASGTFGLRKPRTALRVWDELAPLASPEVVARYPRGTVCY